jgi:hypothetical protein
VRRWYIGRRGGIEGDKRSERQHHHSQAAAHSSGKRKTKTKKDGSSGRMAMQ